MNTNNESGNIDKKINAIFNTCEGHYGKLVSSEKYTRDSDGIIIELNYNDNTKIFSVDNNPVTLPDELLQRGWGELSPSLMQDYENELKENPLIGIMGLNPTKQMKEELSKFNQENLGNKLDKLIRAAEIEYGPKCGNDLDHMRTTFYEGMAYATAKLVGETIQIRADDHPFILPDIKKRGLWVPISGNIHSNYHERIKNTSMNEGSTKELLQSTQDASKWKATGTALFQATKELASMCINNKTINQGYHQKKMYMSFGDFSGQTYQFRFNVDANTVPETKVNNLWTPISGDLLDIYQTNLIESRKN